MSQPRSAHGGEETHITVVNSSDQDIIVRWIDHDGVVREGKDVLIKCGERSRERTKTGHVFGVFDAETGATLRYITVGQYDIEKRDKGATNLSVLIAGLTTVGLAFVLGKVMYGRKR